MERALFDRQNRFCQLNIEIFFQRTNFPECKKIKYILSFFKATFLVCNISKTYF